DQGRTGYRSELEGLIEKYDLSEVVRFVDHCNDMPAAFMLADLVVSASTDPEAFGRIVPEAQAMGRPVIVSNHGGARETVIEGETGWLTEPGDAGALADAITRVLDLSEAARNQMAKRAIANVRENFSRQSMCTKTLEVYNDVLRLKMSA
ncbi:MAG: glycosyltransferase, partial [Rhodospirillales bacterium]|nr:glycosyltransferase [Rhodospirillales bacterium]